MAKNRRRPELLAPAGDLTCVYSAVAAGCDAVYFGGQRFNARQGAGNFSEEDMRTAVRYCTLHGVKTFLTVNTVVKECEWNDFIRAMDEMADTGVTGVIVQDMGVAAYIHNRHPELELHASTQMSVHSLEGVQFLEERGFTRVVLARELSLEEVQRIRDHTTIELETFIHGALCYSVSGQCLLSSVIGGRSGNRGQCAQPCRLPYRLENGEPMHLMNLKDMCTLEEIQTIAASGVDSLKIEGRLKSPEYVYGVTKSYRMALDGRLSERDLIQEKQKLAQLFNRGGFSKGYWFASDNMIEKGSPKHQGLRIGQIESIRSGKIWIRSNKKLSAHDVVEVRTAKPPYPSYQLQERNLENNGFLCWITAEDRVEKGMPVYRLRDEQLMKTLSEPEEPKLKIKANVSIAPGEPCLMTVQHENWTVRAEGGVVQKAEKAALTTDTVTQAVQKTGGTPFEMEELTLHLAERSFLPVSALNRLRRDALQKLEEVLSTRRFAKNSSVAPYTFSSSPCKEDFHLETVISTLAQWNAVKKYDGLAFFRMDKFSDEALAQLANAAKDIGHAWGFSLPYYSTEEEADRIRSLQEKLHPEHVLVHNFGQLMQYDTTVRCHLDLNIPVTNQISADFWLGEADSVTLSPELTAEEMTEMHGPGLTALVYGRLPVMITRQCLRREGAGCVYGNSDACYGTQFLIYDRKQEPWICELHCDRHKGEIRGKGCLNILYTGAPLWMADRKKTLHGLPVSAWRLHFLNENEEQTCFVMESYLQKDKDSKRPEEKIIRGHFFTPCL